MSNFDGESSGAGFATCRWCQEHCASVSIAAGDAVRPSLSPPAAVTLAVVATGPTAPGLTPETTPPTDRRSEMFAGGDRSLPVEGADVPSVRDQLLAPSERRDRTACVLVHHRRDGLDRWTLMMVSVVASSASRCSARGGVAVAASSCSPWRSCAGTVRRSASVSIQLDVRLIGRHERHGRSERQRAGVMSTTGHARPLDHRPGDVDKWGAGGAGLDRVRRLRRAEPTVDLREATAV